MARRGEDATTAMMKLPSLHVCLPEAKVRRCQMTVFQMALGVE